MTLGYFLSAFLGIENLAFGDTTGKISIDWWLVEAEHLDDYLRTSDRPQKHIKLWAFRYNGDTCELFAPGLRESDGSFLELTHAFVTDKVMVWALRGGKHKVCFSIDGLCEIARKTLSGR